MRALVILLVLARAVAAQPTDDKATAEALFQEGRKLLTAERYTEACPKFEASLRLDPSGSGTEINLALCYEKLGRFASAWGMYKQAADDARKINDAEREAAARARAAALEPKLSRLTIQLPKDPISDLVVTRNGSVVDIALLNTPMIVDPGAQKIECKAPGRKPWTQELQLGVSTTLVAAVPALSLDSTQVVGGNNQLQITVDERSEQYEIQVTTTGGTLRCDGFVTRDRPCKLTAPAGPAVVSIHGPSKLTEELELSGKPLLLSIEKNPRTLLYAGVVTAGIGVLALGAGLVACSSRDDLPERSTTDLVCLGGLLFGGTAVVAGGAMTLYYAFTDKHAVRVHGDGQDDSDAVPVARRKSRVFTAPTTNGAVVGLSGSF